MRGALATIADEDIVRLILDGTVVKARMDKRLPISPFSLPSVCAGMARRYCFPS